MALAFNPVSLFCNLCVTHYNFSFSFPIPKICPFLIVLPQVICFLFRGGLEKSIVSVYQKVRWGGSLYIIDTARCVVISVGLVELRQLKGRPDFFLCHHYALGRFKKQVAPLVSQNDQVHNGDIKKNPAAPSGRPSLLHESYTVYHTPCSVHEKPSTRCSSITDT